MESTYNTLKIYKKFLESGFNERQAEALVYAIADAFGIRLSGREPCEPISSAETSDNGDSEADADGQRFGEEPEGPEKKDMER